MSGTNVTQIGRGLLPVYTSGGTNALRFWAYNGVVASSDGDAIVNQMLMPWNGRVRYAYLNTVNDPGACIIGVHLDRNLTPNFSNSVTPSGANVITQVRLQTAFAAGEELGFSVDPANDPGNGYLVVAVEYDSAVL